MVSRLQGECKGFLRPPAARVTTTRKVAPPRQLRSQRTLERILDATQTLLDKRDFDTLGV